MKLVKSTDCALIFHPNKSVAAVYSSKPSTSDDRARAHTVWLIQALLTGDPEFTLIMYNRAKALKLIPENPAGEAPAEAPAKEESDA